MEETLLHNQYVIRKKRKNRKNRNSRHRNHRSSRRRIRSHSNHSRRFSGNFTTGGLQATVENGRLRIQRECRFKKFVPQIEAQTFSGEMALKRGQEITYITERCVLELDENGLTIIEIAPGARLQEDLLDQADIPLRVSPNLRQMPAEIFQPEPMGLQLTPKTKAQ